MIRIFLVEEDAGALGAFRNRFDWQAHGCEICGEAGDGERAFALIGKLEPDIVITDIRMPFMDGLVLSRLIRRKMPLAEVIVLTKERDFESARECVELGVAAYLLKPAEEGELFRVIDALAERIREKNRERENSERYRKERTAGKKGTVPPSCHGSGDSGPAAGGRAGAGTGAVGRLV